jgi:hypothetical protein
MVVVKTAGLRLLREHHAHIAHLAKSDKQPMVPGTVLGVCVSVVGICKPYQNAYKWKV